VVVAPRRAERPGAGGVPEDECPFCAGREDRTPPETMRLGDPWRVRVFPNLYPALERQEIVVHTPDHRTSFADLDDEETALVAEAWEQRARAAEAEGFGYVQALINEGRAAGASREHTHSQLVWLREQPPAVQDERLEGLDPILARDDLALARRDGLTLAVHPAGGAPYEMVVAGDGSLADALALLRLGVERLRAVEGRVPWNAWLHAAGRLHLHLMPRLSVMAGLELGAGIYVNTVAPEDAAVRLRG
jgi:UDPglucose--hexose-1-phosphate uridylyltransferase